MVEQVREYKIISKIGEGGMGVVYKAFDENLDRYVALKAIHSALTVDDNIVARFKNEAKVQASLIHPNIVSLFTFFKENNTYFMVMEYVEGITLKELIKQQNQLSEKLAINILLQLLEGLSYAHSMGVVHRDLKPSNILITSEYKAKILDFGIAKVLGDRGLTLTGTKLGTIYYMSPEQIKAQKDIDQRTDIYSLGIILYEMLTGKVPFNANTESDFEIMQEIVYNPIKSPKTFNPSVSNKIVEVFENMTKKDRELRYRTCYQCSEDIKGSSFAEDRKEEKKTPQIDLVEPIKIVEPVKIQNEFISRKIKDVKLIRKIENFDGVFRSLSQEGDVRSVAFHPNSKILASGDSSSKVKLWDVNTGELIKTFQEHNDIIRAVAFSRDGKWIASGSWDNTIKILDVNSSQLIRNFQGHKWGVYSVAFNLDSKRIVSGSSDKTIKLWDVNSGQLIRTIEGHNHCVNSVAFSPDGKQILSGSSDETIKLWDVNSGQLIRTFEKHNWTVNSVAFSPDGKWIASGSRDNTIKLWDANSGQLIRTFQGHNYEVTSVAFSPDGKWIVSGSSDNTIILWDVVTGKEIKTFDEHYSAVTSVAFSSVGNYLASGSADKTISIFEIIYE